MDISIKIVGGASGISEKLFKPGDRVWSMLYRDDDGVLERLDVLPEELDQVEVNGRELCRWSQVIKEPETSQAEERKAALRSTEEVFLSLYEETDESSEEAAIKDTRDRLKYFLAIQLERKRILKQVQGNRYRHVASKREYGVPMLELTPELVVAFREEMASLGKGL